MIIYGKMLFKMKNKEHNNARTVFHSNRKIVERIGGNAIQLTHKYMTVLFTGLITGTSIKSGGAKLVL